MSSLGVDRLSLSFPLDGRPDPRGFKGGRVTAGIGSGKSGASFSLVVPLATHEERHGTQTRIKVDHALFVGAMEVDGAWFGKVETNPSRYGDPRGCSLLPTDELPEAVEYMADVAGTVIPNILDSVSDWKVKRLDLARDFRGIPDSALFVRSLCGLPRPYARRSFTYRDPKRNRAETLAVGSGAGMVRLYDQHAAYAAKGAPEGSLRWEVECRQAWLHDARVSQLSPGFLDALGFQRWQWSACGTPVASSMAGLVRVLESRTCRHPRPRNACSAGCDLMSPAVAVKLLGQFSLAAAGVGSGLSERSRRRHAVDARAVGAVLDPDAAGQGEEVWRLDWSAGTVAEVPF